MKLEFSKTEVLAMMKAVRKEADSTKELVAKYEGKPVVGRLAEMADRYEAIYNALLVLCTQETGPFELVSTK